MDSTKIDRSQNKKLTIGSFYNLYYQESKERMFKTNNKIHKNVVLIRLFNLVTVQTTNKKNFLLDIGILLNFFLLNCKIKKKNTIIMYTL